MPYQRGAIFPPPATDAAISSLQRQLGQTLPPSLVDIYKVCDGSPKIAGDPLAENLFYSYRFLSVAEVFVFAKGLDTVRLETRQELFPNDIPSFPRGAVRESYVGAGWIPFAHDGAGGHLAIDFTPGPSGTIGQVINFGPDDRVHFQLATNFEAFLERVVRDYEQKKYHYFFGETMMFVDRLLQERQ